MSTSGPHRTRRDDETGWEHVYRVIQRWYWPALILLFLFSVALGGVGYWRFFQAAGESPSFFDLLYRGLLLPQFKAGELDPGTIPWEINVARFLGPAILATATVGAIVGLFSTRVNRLRARFAEDHVVICGLSTKGFMAAKSLSSDGRSVVVIEHDPAREFVRDVRAKGMTLILGDATDPTVLRRAGAHRARFVLAVCSEDAVNASIAEAVRQIRRQDAGILTCLVHVRDPRLCSVLREQEIWASSHAGFSLEFFSVYEAGALAMVNSSAVLRAQPAGKPLHLLVVGAGAVAESFVSQVVAQRRRSGLTQPDGMSVTIMGRGADEFVRRVSSQTMCVQGGCGLQALDGELTPATLPASGLLKPDRSGAARGIYVCMDDDQAAVTNALIAVASARETGVPVLVAIKDEALLSLFIATSAPGMENLTVISMLERLCDPEILFGGLHEQIARAMHEDYVLHQTADRGRAALSEPSLRPWADLPEHFKESNRDAAADVGRKLEAANCMLTPLLSWDEELLRFTDQEVDLLAEMEHSRWRDHLEAEGWTHGQTRDDERKKRPQLVPWNELEESERDKDREQVRLLPAVLAMVGYRPVRKPDAA